MVRITCTGVRNSPGFAVVTAAGRAGGSGSWSVGPARFQCELKTSRGGPRQASNTHAHLVDGPLAGVASRRKSSMTWPGPSK